MKSKFEIRVNGKKFEYWKSATIQRSIDQMVGAFSFESSYRKDFPVNPGDAIQVLINEVTVLTGFAFKKTLRLNQDGHIISITGYDKTKDIADSSLPNSAKNISGSISLKALCEKVIKGLGANIKVVDQTGGIDPFTDKESEYGASVSSAFQFLQSFARKRQVYLITNGQGDLVLYKPDPANKAGSGIYHEKNGERNNVLSYNADISHEERFYKIVCRSSDNFGYDDNADYESEGNNRQGTATDTEIRSSRYFEIMAEQNMTDAECLKRAKEEVNGRRRKSMVYNCDVASAVQPSGSLWDIGLFTSVKDDFVPMKGIFLIKNYSITQEINRGTITSLSLVQPDAYTAQDQISKQTARKALIGNKAA
jgi:prophage tail gpP-like protein